MGEKVVYASFDIEADGPSPLTNNMLSLGIVFVEETTQKTVKELLIDFKPLPGHKAEKRTMTEFWSQHQQELKRIQENAIDFKTAMTKLDNALRELRQQGGYTIKWVARPAAFDWQWLNCYHALYAQKYNLEAEPLGFKAICLSTMRDIYGSQAKLSSAELRDLCVKWGGDQKMTHNALDDAKFQGNVFFALSKELAKNK